MIKKVLYRVLSLTVVTVMLLSSVPGTVRADDPPQPPDVKRPVDRPPVDVERVDEVSYELAMSKIDPTLREAAQVGGKDSISLYVSAKEGTDLSKYLSRIIARPALLGKQNIYGQTIASNLLKIAQEPNVLALVAVGSEMRDKPYDPEAEDAPDRADVLARLEALRANEMTYIQAQAADGGVGVQGWFDVLDGHKAKEAWDKGFTGEGVIVGVLDDGIDFGHPDLQGTAARVTDPASPYYGWPMAFSQVSMLYFVQDIVFNVSGIASGWGGSRWTDAQTTVEAHAPFEGGTAKAMYQPLGSGIPHEYTIPTTSQSNFYKLGSHPERNLLGLYGERVAVLVVDESRSGVYDTVYVDLDNDYDFTDEKPATKASPEIYRDMDGDGYADISGGLLVWVSDGAHPPPTADWLWGITCADASSTMKGCPDAGELVLFAGPFDAGYTHGTNCASNIAGQGVVNDGLTAQPFRVGGMVQGAAPNVGLMDFGNHYYTGTDEDEFLVAALGYDGVPNSGDEVQITSNSYGSFGQMWGSWGYMGRLITALNNTIAPTTVWLFSSGNEGPGYGPQEGDSSPTTIQVGSSTQYGSTNWDSIASANQIMYGDPNSFFAKGPNRDGSSGLDVLANGGRGAGSEGINYYGYNGAESWATWGGTSRSAPVAAGNLALVYEAFKARSGRWPTWSEAKALLKNGATNAVSSPFYQGAGVVNADRATDLAAGIYGVYATPDEWQVGDWQGTEYLNFAKVAEPGDAFTKTYTVNNPSGYDISVSLSDGVMKLIEKTELSFTTSDESEESDFNFHSPDYLMELDESLIPADAEVMIVRYVHPYDTFDPAYDYTANPNSSWRFLLYNWTDVNDDGKLWVDSDGNGVVNHVDDLAAGTDNDGFFRPDYANPGTEIQVGEYVRMDYEFGGLSVPIIVRDPIERMADGYYLGWQHRSNDHSIKTTTFKIGIEFYKRADWVWLELSQGSLSVPAEGSATFDAVVEVPPDAAPGAYEGVVVIQDPGSPYHSAHETALSVVLNVMADLPAGGSVTLGGEAMADTMYQNSWTHGYFNWYGGGWTGAGDWRHYFLNIDSSDVTAGDLLVHTSWMSVPTDINTWVLGPTADCASNGTGSCAWYQPGLGQPDPTVYGPYTLQPIAWSEPFRSGAAYPFRTSSGGADDWLKVPMDQAGLYAIALHNVLYSGEELAEQFRVDVGTIALEASVDPAEGDASAGLTDVKAYTETGSVEIQFTPTLELPDLEAMLTGGLATTHYGPFTSMVPDSGQCYSAWCPDNVYEEITVGTPGATRLGTHLYMPANQDADFFLVYDSDNNGVPEQAHDAVVGSSGNSSGTDEEILVDNPTMGRYWVVIDGYDVDPDSGVNLDWDYHITAPGLLPTFAMDAFSDTVTIDQDMALDPTTASFSTTVTTTNRVAALNVVLSDIPADADVDLYVSDEMGDIIAMSQERGNDDEEIVLVPTAGEYRFAEGEAYTVWVHGYNVPTPPATPHLRVWWDVNNLWLSASHPDVHPSSIGEGETVSVILHWDQPGWEPGEHPHGLGARLLVGSSVMPGAFDELVSIDREDPPGPAEWDPANLDIAITADSDRGPSPSSRWTVGGVPIPTALVAAGERVTYTVRVQNMDPLDSPGLIVDAWPLPEDYAGTWFGVLDRTDGVGYGLIDGTLGSADYGGGISWDGVISSGHSIEFSYWVEMPTDMAPGDDHTSGVDVYDSSWEWFGWALAGGYYRAAQFGLGGAKLSDPPAVLAGDTFDYAIGLVNYSAEDLDVYLSDPLPDEVTFVSATGGATYNAGSHTVTWIGALPGTTLSAVELGVTVQARSDLPYGTVIENVATVSDKFEGPALETLTAYTEIDTGAGLEIEKTVDVLYGSTRKERSYEIVFGNTGDETARNVVMTDEVPLYLEVIADSVTASKASAGAKLFDDGTIQWEGDLGPDEEVTVSFRAMVNGSASNKLALINGAWVMADNYPTKMYDSAVSEIASIFYLHLPLITR